MTRAALVTGVAGFIGSHLAERLLAEGWRVSGVDDLSAGLREQVPAGCDLVEGRIQHLTAGDLRGVEVVFHLAAKNCVRDCEIDPFGTFEVNAAGTAHLLQVAAEAGVGKVVLASTAAVYEDVTEMPSQEDVVRPRSNYGMSKLLAEQLVRSRCDRAGMRWSIVRYFNVYGTRQDVRRTIVPVIPAFALALAGGEAPVVYGDGTRRRDFVHVADATRLTASLSDRGDGVTVNVGTGESRSVLEILDAVSRVVGVRREPRHLPEFSFEAKETRADVRRAAQLGWEPEITLEEGVAECVGRLGPVVPGDWA
jgi:UDP-glucose 4-epimerase